MGMKYLRKFNESNHEELCVEISPAKAISYMNKELPIKDNKIAIGIFVEQIKKILSRKYAPKYNEKLLDITDDLVVYGALKMTEDLSPIFITMTSLDDYYYLVKFGFREFGRINHENISYYKCDDIYGIKELSDKIINKL